MNYARTATFLSAAIATTLVWTGIGVDTVWTVPLTAAAVGVIAAAYWFGTRMARSRIVRLRRDGLPGAAITTIMQDLSARAGVAVPRLFLVDSESPNAFASGRGQPNASIAVTTGLLASLSGREIRGVVAHEIAHIVRDDARFLTLAALGCGLIAGAGGLAIAHETGYGLLVMALSSCAAGLCQMWISRTREHGADRLGADICGNPLWIAAALERIETVNLNAAASPHGSWAHDTFQFGSRRDRLLSVLSTHPSTGDRIVRLRRLAGLSDPWV